MTWWGAMAWADYVSFGGHDEWRLPAISPELVEYPLGSGVMVYDYEIDNVCQNEQSVYSNKDCGYNVLTDNSELAFLFHNQLGNISSLDENGDFVNNPNNFNLLFTDPVDGLSKSFDNVGTNRSFMIGSITGSAPATQVAWSFKFYCGLQVNFCKNCGRDSWLVADGDIANASTGPGPITLVTEPAMLGLFGIAVMGLGIRRKKSSAEQTLN
jgi:hypothetical protein